MSERELLARLSAVCELRDELEIDEFVETVAALRERTDSGVLRHLLRAFRDVDAGEVQYELVEACEAFPEHIYVRSFVEESETLFKKAPWWFQLMFQSLLNTESCKVSLKEQWGSLSQGQRAFFLGRLEALAKADQDYAEISADLHQAEEALG